MVGGVGWTIEASSNFPCKHGKPLKVIVTVKKNPDTHTHIVDAKSLILSILNYIGVFRATFQKPAAAQVIPTCWS